MDQTTAHGESGAGPLRAGRLDVAPFRLGSEAHKQAFCSTLLDSFRAYEPDEVLWPALDETARQDLAALPIWDIAVDTERKASRRVLRYARTVSDPLLRRAVELNGFEEARHERLLRSMLDAYGIPVPGTLPYAEPRDREWAFMVTGFSECIDSFFAFGLFEAARRAGLFPAALADAFEPVMQEEGRHILFFVNWAAWHRRTLPWWRKPIFAAKILAVWAFLVWERLRTARDLGGSNFTMTGSRSVGIALDAGSLLDLCLAEQERRLAPYDPRLIRPVIVPRLVSLIRRIMTLPVLGTGRRRGAP